VIRPIPVFDKGEVSDMVVTIDYSGCLAFLSRVNFLRSKFRGRVRRVVYFCVFLSS
jgi:hypothetical protein